MAAEEAVKEGSIQPAVPGLPGLATIGSAEDLLQSFTTRNIRYDGNVVSLLNFVSVPQKQ